MKKKFKNVILKQKKSSEGIMILIVYNTKKFLKFSFLRYCIF